MVGVGICTPVQIAPRSLFSPKRVDGPHGIVAIVETEAIVEIREALIDEIKNIEGMKETTTNLIISKR
ncbi:hypothetical protein AKJ40_03245 [candidate division MSBL1 archaeon SCGC-AAA259M10]|uniref:Transcription regulator AsnC/Lrp ligand binding domain-containing protein n=1 Tax=candidate division MSBL1 archaeon SCGC-AAA259M10 TaxID=1698270 RepID=A0A133UYW1_9EURY|nr:hypothetical protein AKJ40_03245 [candidate division MSBL1 archaeon SCGC-AAA259M10]